MFIPTITLQQSTARGCIGVSALLQGTGVKMKYEPVQFEKLIRCRDGAQWFIVYLLPVGLYNSENHHSKNVLFHFDTCEHWHSATQYTRIYVTCYVPLHIFQWPAKGILG